jgi:hypothetical protein
VIVVAMVEASRMAGSETSSTFVPRLVSVRVPSVKDFGDSGVEISGQLPDYPDAKSLDAAVSAAA